MRLKVSLFVLFLLCFCFTVSCSSSASSPQRLALNDKPKPPPILFMVDNCTLGVVTTNIVASGPYAWTVTAPDGQTSGTGNGSFQTQVVVELASDISYGGNTDHWEFQPSLSRWWYHTDGWFYDPVNSMWYMD